MQNDYEDKALFEKHFALCLIYSATWKLTIFS